MYCNAGFDIVNFVLQTITWMSKCQHYVSHLMKATDVLGCEEC